MCSVWPRALEWKVQGWLKKRNDPLMEKSSFFSLQNRSLFCNQTYLSIFLQCRSMIMVRSQRPQQEPSGGHTLAEGCWRKALKHVLASHLAGIGCHNTDTLTPSHTHTHTHSHTHTACWHCIAISSSFCFWRSLHWQADVAAAAWG